MKKLDSSHDKETPQEELKRLRKECKKLASQKDKFKAKYDKAQKELKKKDVRKITFLNFRLICSDNASRKANYL